MQKRAKLASRKDKERLSRVEIVGVYDKRQITAVFATSFTRDFLPPQFINKG